MFAQELLVKGVALSELLRLCTVEVPEQDASAISAAAAPREGGQEAQLEGTRALLMAQLATWMVEPGVDRGRRDPATHTPQLLHCMPAAQKRKVGSADQFRTAGWRRSRIT